jgi:hypothetical protein
LLVLILVGLIAPFGSIPFAHAAIKQYRCAGRVQYRPCDAFSESSQPSSRRPRTQSADELARSIGVVSGPRFAQLVKAEFSKVDKSSGLWKGSVRGNGLVELELQIFRGSERIDTRYMGSVWLRNKVTKFRFKSPLPSIKGWRWQITTWSS